MKQRVAIVGQGNVGGALARGLARAGYDMRTVDNDPAAARDAADWGDIVILAVPYSAIDAVVSQLGSAVDGKVVVDVTNALTADYQPALGFTTSGAEELQKKTPAAKVVKAFNTVFAQHMDTGRVKGQRLSLFMASDDRPQKRQSRYSGGTLGSILSMQGARETRAGSSRSATSTFSSATYSVWARRSDSRSFTERNLSTEQKAP
jgi:predicted dinucleotide-binding enzyme